MGFWESFLGHTAANVYSEMRKEEQANKKWNDLFYELGEYETSFSNYLKSIGCPALYVADVEAVNNGNIAPEKRKMDNYKKKLNDFISLGGQVEYIHDLDEIDNEIETIKYLKKMGCLHRQEEFIGLGLYLTQSTLERELQGDHAIEILLNTPNNELSNIISEGDADFALYNDIDDGDNVIKIETAQVYDEKIVDFLQFKTVALKFTSKNIYIYNYKEHTKMYYKTTISDGQKLNIISTPIPAVEGWGLIQINGLEVMFSLEEVEKVKELYREHNENIDVLNNQMKQKLGGEKESINSRSDFDMSEFEPFCVSNAKIWNEEAEEFQDLQLTITFSTTKVSMYTALLQQDFFAQDFPEGTHVETEIIDINNPKQSVLRFAGSLLVLMDTDDAYKVKGYYDSYREKMEEIAETKQNRIKEISNEIEGLNDMAMNMLNMTDEHILLNHDAVIGLQLLLAYKKFPNVKLWDEDSLSSSENTLLGIAVVKQAVENMVEVIQEEHSEYTDEEISFACWEAIKRVSVSFYSDMWEEKYGKYIDEPLKQNTSTEADGTLDKYIEEIIRCNEIDDTDIWVMGIFTYYLMDKGYATGELYFPPYYEIAIQAFNTIRDNVKKNQFKEKLKGTVKKQETHYTIDDIDMMNGNEFEYFICELYTKMGYRAEVTKQSGDQGLDVIAEKGDKKIGIQAKCYSGTVGNSAVQEAVAGKSFYHCDKVIVITNNFFTSSAKELAQSNDVILWDRDILKEKIKELM